MILISDLESLKPVEINKIDTPDKRIDIISSVCLPVNIPGK